ncbi:unnamed protein product [Tuber melanosporum]|uniref:GDP-mannose transporter n=1 Tax=Tuber melanosporum (strain Mel28) TaxID=656061 RepID=D5G816_TUBMM|nr:uncharacterized protein GSTUM_00002705001 [Tuber melanosporum]CAZ80659.1 unnamed protein product [Tuber melanosporum]
MNRSPASRFFRKPHEILASSSIPSTTPFSHSRARNRSSGGSSVSSHQGQPNLLVESSSSSDEDGPPNAASWRPRSKSQNRSVSPPWNVLSPHSIPLLPMRSGASGQGTGGGGNLMSRTPSPFPRNSGDLDTLGSGGGGAGCHEWRIGKGSESESRGFAKWTRNGRLGWWLWNTQRGWVMYIGLLVTFYEGAAFTLSKVNGFTLLTGVYKFVYPITTTLFQLIMTQIFLYFAASVTRSFSRSLHTLGLGSMVAPLPTPSKGKRRASGGGLRDFAKQLATGSREGCVFELKWTEAKKVVPVALIYSLKIVLSNIGFAYTNPPIYHLSRVGSLLLAMAFTHLFTTNSLSVTTMSSCITMVLSLAMAVLRPGTRFAIEGFLAGLFSTIFVAAYPILLTKAYKSVLRGNPNTIGSGDLLGVGPTDGMLSTDGGEETRSAWKLLHYVNVLSITMILPWIFLSGEFGDISRNCYILDLPWFWLMGLFSGLGAWATFVSGFLLLRATTPLTMVASTYPRTAFQALLMHGSAPTWSWVGVLMCWGSSVWYLLGRRKECGVSFFHAKDGRGLFGADPAQRLEEA